MNGRYLYLQILLQMLLIIALTIAGFWIFLHSYYLGLIPIVLSIVWLGFHIINYPIKINNKITYFFNAVENEDSTLYFPEQIQNHATKELNKSLNRLNKLVQEVKLKNKEQEQFYSALLEKVATGILVINTRGNILHTNSEARKLLNHNTLTHIMQLRRINENLYNAFAKLQENERKLVQIKHDNDDSIIQLRLQSSSFSSINEYFMLVSIQDIRSELDTKEIDSWLKLIRVLTHEIMNSITPITSLSETIMNYYTNDKTIDNETISNTIKGLEVINERGAGLIQFVKSYRALTRIPSPTLELIRIDSLMNNILVLLENEPTFPRISFISEITPQDLSIEVDKTQISQVIINLIKNAIQAVSTVENPKIKVIARLNFEKNCEIVVIDNGIGIPKELMEQIFIPFFTTKENGSGIGLSLSKQIMRNHKGSIKVYSNPKKLTKFTLVF